MKLAFSFLKSHWVLGIILLIGILLRFYGLNSVPPSASIDEVSIGWNAYSILKTGKDEYGNFLPMILRAYDDFRPGLYVYSVVPFVWIFGLEAISVRLPSAIMSILVIVATFIFVEQIDSLKKYRITWKKFYLGPSHIAAFLLSISPWHIYLSRLGHEVNLGLFGVIFGVASFYLFISNTKKYFYLFLSAVFFVSGLYGYQSEKIIIPWLIIVFGILYRNILMTHVKLVLLVSIFGIVLLIPFFVSVFSPEGLIRLKATSVFSKENSWNYYSQRELEYVAAREKGDLVGRITNNPLFSSIRLFSYQYMSHFSPTWLFTGGMNESHKVPNLGLLYWWEFPLILIGIIASFFHQDRKSILFIWLWFLSSPIPAAITTQAPHALRSYTFLPLWQVFAAIGLVVLFNKIKNSLNRVVLSLGLCVIILMSTYSFVINYFYIFPHTQSESFSYALSAVMPYIQEHSGEYDTVVFSNRIGINQFRYPSYMFYLFYTTYDPATYLLNGGTGSGSFDANHILGKYEFREINANERNKKTLYVTNFATPKNGEIVKHIGTYKNGLPGVIAYSYE